MAQYSKDVYNLAPGLGRALNDPREDEARALEASQRADQELALRRQQQAQAQALAQRQMALSEQAAAFEQALASQARGGMTPAYGDGQAAGPSSQRGPLMGRDALNRQAHNAAAQERAYEHTRNQSMNLDQVFGGGPATRQVWEEGVPVDGKTELFPRRIPLSSGNGYVPPPVQGRVPDWAMTGEYAPGGGVQQAGRLSPTEAMAEALGFRGAETELNLKLRDMVNRELEASSVAGARKVQGEVARGTLQEGVRSNKVQEALARDRFGQIELPKSAADIEALFREVGLRELTGNEQVEASKAQRELARDRFGLDRELGTGSLALQRQQAAREDEVAQFQMNQALRQMTAQEREKVGQFVTTNEDVMKFLRSGEPSAAAAMAIDVFKTTNPEAAPFFDALVTGPRQTEVFRDAGHSAFRPRSDGPILRALGPGLEYFDNDREREGPALDRALRAAGVDQGAVWSEPRGHQQGPARLDPRYERQGPSPAGKHRQGPARNPTSGPVRGSMDRAIRTWLGIQR